jgi:hypothetical protein
MSAFPGSERDKHIPLNNLYPPTPDIERGGSTGSYTRINDHLTPGTAGHGAHLNTPGSHDSNFFHEATNYDYRRGPEQFRVAQGDIPDTKVRYSFFCRPNAKLLPYTRQVTRFYHYLIGASIVTRWAIFIIPILGLLWIPVSANYHVFIVLYEYP